MTSMVVLKMKMKVTVLISTCPTVWSVVTNIMFNCATLYITFIDVKTEDEDEDDDVDLCLFERLVCGDQHYV